MALAMLLHDVGMSKVPPFIVQKTSPLKSEEKDKILLHVLVSTKMIQKLDLGWDELIHAALEHHERLDGSGYPRKSEGSAISDIGRITAVADSFVAMISERSYASAMEPEEACRLLVRDNNRYDPIYCELLQNALLTKEIVIPPLQEINKK